MKERHANSIKLVLFTALLGGFAGAVIWCFLKAVSLCTSLLWVRIPESTGISWIPLIICTLGGLITGVLHRIFGDYPEELDVVMGRIKKDKHYDYHPMAVMLVCAFIPLICASSVGPEAGLTGIIAALCYWVGDNVTFAKRNSELFSEIGEAVTLGQLFHSPLFGILAVEEGGDGDDDATVMLTRGNKLLFYGISTGAGFLAAYVLTYFFGTAMEGFPAFADAPMGACDYLMLLVYIPVGLLLYLIFELCEKLTKGAGRCIPVTVRETVCGLVIGAMGLALPIVMSSGEEQMGELMETFVSFSPLFLAGICVLKIIMTTFCINLGMKGGHFFPLIFACTCMGFALASFVFASDPVPHAAFAAAAVCATMLGAQLKKPIAASLLLLLCFPVKALLCIFLCAACGKSLASVFSAGRGGKGFASGD